MSTEIQVDDETRAALLLFNERVEASAAEERAAKRTAKAERAKDEAAAVVRKTNDNPGASVEEKAEAEAAYKAAVENFQMIKADPMAGLDQPKPKAKPEEPAAAPEEPAATTADGPDEASAVEDSAAATTADGPDEAIAVEDSAPAEVSADEEAAPASKADAESE